jgi:hypothetical protein
MDPTDYHEKLIRDSLDNGTAALHWAIREMQEYLDAESLYFFEKHGMETKLVDCLKRMDKTDKFFVKLFETVLAVTEQSDEWVGEVYQADLESISDKLREQLDTSKRARQNRIEEDARYQETYAQPEHVI